MGVDAKGVITIINFGPSRNLESCVRKWPLQQRWKARKVYRSILRSNVKHLCKRHERLFQAKLVTDSTSMVILADPLPHNNNNNNNNNSNNKTTYIALIQSCSKWFTKIKLSSHLKLQTLPLLMIAVTTVALSCTWGLAGGSDESIYSVDQAPTECILPVRNVSEDQFASLKRELVRYKKTWVAYCMQRNMHSQRQFSANFWPSFLMKFGDYHIGQVIQSAPYIASWSDVLKCIEIWRVNHAAEIWKILKKIFADLQDEALPEISDVETDTDGDEGDNDWMRMLKCL